MSAARKKANSLKVVTHNVQMLLGYRELELQGQTLQVPKENSLNTPIFKKNFNAAKSAGTLGAYFKNRRVNNDCAVAIDEAIQKNKVGKDGYALEDAAKTVIAEFGKERAEWVLSAFINDAPTDKFNAHKKWASQKNQSTEPQNIQINTHPAIMDIFTERFVDVSNRKPKLSLTHGTLSGKVPI